MLPVDVLTSRLFHSINRAQEGFSSVQSLSRVRFFATPWTAACQASLSITNSRSLLKIVSIESVMPSNHLILCCPLLLLPSIYLSIRVFSKAQLFASGGQSTEASGSASVLPMNILCWFLWGMIGLISLLFKGLSRIFSSTKIWKLQFFFAQLSLYSPTLTSEHHYWKNHTFVSTDLC